MEDEGLSMLPQAPEVQLQEIESAAASLGVGEEAARERVELRRTALALTQIACTDDAFQLGRASLYLAQAYLDASMPQPAIRHAQRAEALLRADVSGAEKSSQLLPTATLALARALTARAAAFAAAADAATASARARATHRQQASTLFLKSAECFYRALASSHEVFGKRHVASCPILRGWARMAVARAKDFTVARQLLSEELAIRTTHASDAPSDAEVHEMHDLRIELAQLCLSEAKALGRSDGGLEKAVALRGEAVRVLRKVTGDAPSEGEHESRSSEMWVTTWRTLGEALKGSGEWEQALEAYMRAFEAAEELNGCAHEATLDLWTEVSRLTLKTKQYDAAAAALRHLINLHTVVLGANHHQMIAHWEALCKCYMFMQPAQMRAAKEALMQAHIVSCARNGRGDDRSLRLEQVLDSFGDESDPED